MKKKKSPRPAKAIGRPELGIDPKKVEQYAQLGMKTTEIAGMFDCDEGVIRRRFKKEYLAGKGKRALELRAAQYKKMQSGDTAMLIFLGKNELGQADRIKSELTGDNGGPIQTQQAKEPFDWDAYRKARGSFGAAPQ